MACGLFRHNPECDVFAHTYDIRDTTTRRNHEHNVRIYPRDVYGLTQNVVMDNMDAYATRVASRDFHLRHKNIAHMGWTQEQVSNMKKQWISIERVWDIMEQHALTTQLARGNTSLRPYDRIGLFRLDIKYETPIHIHRGAAVLPLFGEHVGVNDRMFYGDYKYAKIWATTRFKFIYRWKHSGSMNSERYLKQLLDHFNVPYETAPCVCFERVRANNKIDHTDLIHCRRVKRRCHGL